MPLPVISVNNISKLYKIHPPHGENASAAPFSGRAAGDTGDKFWALKNISFQLNEGDVTGIIGKNGSGKSTLLKILSGITRPTAGTVKTRGALTSILEIGSGFHPDLTGMENIFFYGSVLGMKSPDIRRQLSEIIDFSGIGKFIHTPVKHYSSGMMLRLGLAIAIHSELKILLLDEVLAVGDAEFKMKTAEKIEAAIINGTTVMMVSHGMGEVMQLCNHCIVLESGTLVYSGTPAEAISNYLESSLRENEAPTLTVHERGTYRWKWPEINSAPGNQNVKLHEVSIRPMTEADRNVIYVEDTVLVEVQFWKLRSPEVVHISLLFHDILNNPVFYASTLHNLTIDSQHSVLRHETGLFSFTCSLPPRFFNCSPYSIQVRFGSETSELYIHKELFHFKISEKPGEIYPNIRPLVLRPSFPWKHEKIASL